jgi:hypothetical protein
MGTDEEEELLLFPELELGKERTPGAIAPRRRRVDDHITNNDKKTNDYDDRFASPRRDSILRK